MSAQSEFVSIWAIIAIGLFVIDVYLMGIDELRWELFAGKWLIIVAFSLLSHERVGPLFHLATGDVVAIMAAAALFAPVMVVVFYVLLKVVDLLMARRSCRSAARTSTLHACGVHDDRRGHRRDAAGPRVM